MRYLKITLRNKPGNTELVYPDNYQVDIGNFNFQHRGHLYYDDENGEPRLLLAIADKDWKDSMVRTDVEEITEVQMKALSESHENRAVLVTNEGELRRLELKAKILQLKTSQGLTIKPAEQFSQSELDSLEVGTAKSVFRTEKILADKLEEFKTIETNLKAK
jgi:hypothetical protein